MKIALAHDSLTQMGGAERVLADLHSIFPDAEVFTLVYDKKLEKFFEGWKIQTSSIQKVYNYYNKFQHLLPLIPSAVNSLNFSGFDLVISDSSGFVKNINVPAGCVHINYCHTPPRFLWDNEDYLNQEVPALTRTLVKKYLSWLKKWDVAGSTRVNYFLSNSKEVQARIKKYYNRESIVIYPGINTDFFYFTLPKKNYFLIAGRLQAHKNNELIVKIFNELGWPLHIVGTGRQEAYLKRIAKSNIKFLGRVDDITLRDEYSGALGFIYPQLEDFGLMPLEAAACGTATLALAHGGSLETVVSGQTGELFSRLGKKEIENLLLSWKPEKYNKQILRQQALNFSQAKFKTEILTFVNKIKNNNADSN